MCHYVAATRLRHVAALVRQVGQGEAGDATTREGQGSLFFDAQRLGSVRALVGERSPVQAHAFPKAARAAFGQGVEEWVAGQTVVDSLERWCLLAVRVHRFHVALLSVATATAINTTFARQCSGLSERRSCRSRSP